VWERRVDLAAAAGMQGGRKVTKLSEMAQILMEGR